MPPKTYFGPKGYSIFKNSISVQEQYEIRDELTIIPQTTTHSKNQKYGDAIPFPIYKESQNKLYVPRNYGTKKYGPPQQNKLTAYTKVNLTYAGPMLRDYQRDIVETYMSLVQNSYGGIFELPCGKGKTACAIKIIQELGVKTLYVVVNDSLGYQFKESATRFLPGVRLGTIQGPIIDIEDKDIVVATVQSLSQKDYPESLFSSFGLIISDEVHMVGTSVFSRALSKVNTPYTLGMSATVDRKDGLELVVKHYLGDIFYRMEREPNSEVKVSGYFYQVDDPEFNEPVVSYDGNTNYVGMLSKVQHYFPRTLWVSQIIKTVFEQKPGQQLLVLAHHKPFIHELKKLLVEANFATVGLCIGGMKESAIEESKSKNIIIATYKKASVGLDIITLTTLILSTPQVDVVQSVGRILRTDKVKPHIVDIVDPHDTFINQWNKRKAYYNSLNYKISKFLKDSNYQTPVELRQKNNKPKNKPKVMVFNPKMFEINLDNI